MNWITKVIMAVASALLASGAQGKITLHEPNYFTFGYVDQVNTSVAVEEEHGEYQGMKNTEAKFQFSLKFPLFEQRDRAIMGAFTQTSFWQLGNTDRSSPFRDSNYRPELFSLHHVSRRLRVSQGYRHQSNGRGGALSRSWERYFLAMHFDTSSWGMTLQGWHAFALSDNPDISHYIPPWQLDVNVPIGRGEWAVTGAYGGPASRGFIETSVTHPLTHTLAVFAQYRSGYGDSLLDYRTRNTRITLGFRLFPSRF
ncbi:phospholipase A [Vibrio sp. SCSIO 43169]|uniref:phospholipase A n=1 Tax=Vibrio sp. SCSIO 43169 TaxID=2822801 RepID=UPI002043CD97|nr:phospholipase A [Vibrio sp. SCSIO 43169]